MRNADLADRLELQEIANKVELAVDDKDWEALFALLDHEVTVDFGAPDTLGGVVRPSRKVVDDLADGHPADEVTYHGRMNDIVTIDSDTASLVGLQYAWSKSGGGGELYEVWGRMNYGFRRTDNGWIVTYLKSAKLRDVRRT